MTALLLPWLFVLMSALALAVAGYSLYGYSTSADTVRRTQYLFVLMGALAAAVAGYVSAVITKAFKGTDWKNTIFMTSLMFLGINPALFFTLFSGEKSSGAVPLTTLLALLVMWFCVSVPLVFLGAYFGFRGPFRSKRYSFWLSVVCVVSLSLLVACAHLIV